jgi:hypothetical protein
MLDFGLVRIADIVVHAAVVDHISHRVSNPSLVRIVSFLSAHANFPRSAMVEH